MPNDVYKNYKAPEGGGGQYLKFEDGKPVKLRLMSEPYLFTSQFKEGDPVVTRYAWVVYNYETLKGQILQLPITAFRMIQGLAADDEWGDPTQYDIKITRTGQSLDTKYSVVGSPNKTPITTDMAAAVIELDVSDKVKGSIPLAQIVGGAPIPEPVDQASETESVPVDARTPEGEVNIDEIPF